jgi:hypothetical protein
MQRLFDLRRFFDSDRPNSPLLHNLQSSRSMTDYELDGQILLFFHHHADFLRIPFQLALVRQNALPGGSGTL